MSTAVLPTPSTSAIGPRPRLWTVDQFHHLGDLGLFEGLRAKLIDGVIVEEGPMNPPHAIAATKSEDLIRERFGKGWHVRVSKPLVLGQSMDPEPDAAVVPGKPADYTSHPTTAALVIEISDTSLRYDMTIKMSVYAAGGIADYWVVDVVARQLHVFRNPQPDPHASHGHSYSTRLALGVSDTIAPLAVPNAFITVADLLP
jgi:Uma2 family endonuclease